MKIFLLQIFLFVTISVKCLNGTKLKQNPIEINLSNNWTLVNSYRNISINNLSLPITVHTVLIKEGLIGDPLFRYNDLNLRWIPNDNNWVFQNSFNFDISQIDNNSIVNLVFDSIDTIASVYLNNKFILFARNQFVRYELTNLNNKLVNGANLLQVNFSSPIQQANYLANTYPYREPPECPPDVQHGECHVNFLRKEQCSFSWDWGPMFGETGFNGLANLYIIKNFDFNYSLTVYPQTLPDLKNWIIDLDIRVLKAGNSNVPVVATLRVLIDELSFEFKQDLQLTNRVNNFNQKILVDSRYEVKLWWPNGNGEQKTYDLSIEMAVQGDTSKKSKQIGFRSVELIQEPIDSKTVGLSFYFKINNVPIFLKGSNWIPADVFQEQIKPGYVSWLLKSAKDAHMNVLRVWGGGIYEPDEFYDLANKMGIMIWQDFMFACALYPTNDDYLANVNDEIIYQVNRLRHNPSIIIWAGNNENEAALSTNWYNTDIDRENYAKDYRKLYIDVIKQAVESIDPEASRPYLSSSPTNGKESETEDWLAKNPQDTRYGDMHFYDYNMNTWLAKSFPLPRLMSEFGVQSLPSYSTLSEVYSMPQDADMFGDLNIHRQHHFGNGNQEMINEIKNNLQLPNSQDSLENFKSIIYLTQINQAMTLKTASELFRRYRNEIEPNTNNGHCMGTMYWQFNDLWQAPTWSTIEFQSSTQYNTRGGKWKLAHYFIKNAYANVILSPTVNDTHLMIYAVSDLTQAFNSTFRMKVFSYGAMTEKLNQLVSFEIEPLYSKPVYTITLSSLLSLTQCNLVQNKCLIQVDSDDQRIQDGNKNFLFLNTTILPSDLSKESVSITDIKQLNTNGLFSITLDASSLSLFVYLDINTTKFYGTFSDNGFHLTEPTKTVTYQVEYSSASLNDMKQYLTVRSLASCYGSTKLNNGNRLNGFSKRIYFILFALIFLFFKLF